MSEHDDRELRESMGAFEASLSAEVVTIPRPCVQNILLALDRSNQDATAESLAVTLAQRWNASLHVILADERAHDDTRDQYLVERATILREQVSTTHSTGQDRSFEQIINASREQACDLIVVCAPFGDDFDVIGHASVGTNLDMLLHQTTVPLLVVRETIQHVETCLDTVLLPIHYYLKDRADAAGWAFKIVNPNGTIRLLATTDRETIETAGHLIDRQLDVGELDGRLLAGLGRQENTGLISAMHRRSVEEHLDCEVTVRVGEPGHTVAGLGNQEKLTIVKSYLTDRSKSEYERIHATLCESNNPVLVV